MMEAGHLTSEPPKLPKSRLYSMASMVWPRAQLDADVYSAHVACLGRARGASLFLMGRVLPKAVRRRVTVTAPGSGLPLALRSGTSDMCVYDDIFVHQEYAWTFAAPPRVIIDAGAYTGLSAAYFADRYPDATIISIEPDAENFELLKLNTARFPNVHAIRAAIWGTSGSISIKDPGYGPWGLQVTGSLPRSEDVRAVTVDEIMREFNLDRIDLLKMDVEGSEKEIFAAAGDWISSVDAIVIELHDRIKPGCSTSFFEAVGDFPIQLRRYEDILVARPESRLNPIS